MVCLAYRSFVKVKIVKIAKNDVKRDHLNMGSEKYQAVFSGQKRSK